MKKGEFKRYLKKIWYFIWEDDSLLSWIVNIVLAFLLIKFLIYPGLGFALSTDYPIVAVISGSMEHDGSFNDWWSLHQKFYDDIGISQNNFKQFSFKN